MRKFAPVLLLLLMLLLTRPDSALAQKTAGDYFPLKQGNVWKMAMQIEGRKITGTMQVIKVVKSGNETVATVTQTINGSLSTTEKYRVTPGGIYRISTGKDGSMRTDPALPILKFPAKDGDTWDWQGKMKVNGQENDGMANMTVSGPETVKTPAGTYRAIKVHMILTIDYQGRKVEVPTDYYFASGVGMIRQTMNFGGLDIDARLTSVKLKK